MPSFEPSELKEAAQKLIEEAKCLKSRVETLTDPHGQPLDGCLKLARKIDSEIKFIGQKLSSNNLKESYVNCSNLPYLKSVCEATQLFPLVTSILTPFQPLLTEHLSSSEKLNSAANIPTVVDVVANEGFLWVKVIARSAEGLWNNWLGNCEMSHRSLEEQLEELLSLADLCPVYFKKPTIATYFPNGIRLQMADEIESMGVKVFGHVFNEEFGEVIINDPKESRLLSNTNTPMNSRLVNQIFVNEFATVNLDVSTMLALCSNLTHGYCNWVIPNSKILNMQIRDEAEHAGQLWNELESFLKGKRLVCCETAYNSYTNILTIVGGELEKKRSEKLFENIEIVPDEMSETLERVPVSSSVKDRSKVIFGTGFELQTVTVTSNLSCVRSMRQTGVYFPIYAHVARALTEQKQTNAEKVDENNISMSAEKEILVFRKCICVLCQHAASTVPSN